MKKVLSTFLLTSCLVGPSLQAQELLILEDMQKIADKPHGQNSGDGAGVYRDKDNRIWFVKTIDDESLLDTPEGDNLRQECAKLGEKAWQCSAWKYSSWVGLEVARNYAVSRLLRSIIGPESIPIVMPAYSRERGSLFIGSKALEGFNTAWEVYWKDIYGKGFDQETLKLKEKRAQEREDLLERDALLKVAFSLLNLPRKEIHTSNRGVVSLEGPSGNRTMAAVIDFDKGAFVTESNQHFSDFQKALEGASDYREAIHHIACLKEEDLSATMEAIAAELNELALDLPYTVFFSRYTLALPSKILPSDPAHHSFLNRLAVALPHKVLLDLIFKDAFLSSVLPNLAMSRAMDETLYFDDGLCKADQQKASDPEGKLLAEILGKERPDLAEHLLDRGISHDPENLGLVAAVKKGYLSIVSYLVENNLSQKDTRGTALALAIGNGYIQIARYLLEHNFSQDPVGVALAAAIRKGDEYIAHFLLDHTLSYDPQGRALLAAIKGHRDELVKRLYETGISQDPNREALSTAAEVNSLPLTLYFLEKGYVTDKDLTGALYEALSNGGFPIAEYLMQAIEKHLFPIGSFQFQEAFGNHCYSLLRTLTLCNNNRESFNFALKHRLIQTDAKGRILADALSLSKWEVAQFLLASGITIEQPDQPLDPAIFLEAPLPMPTLKILLEKGFFKGSSLLKKALQKGYSLDMCKSLIEAFNLRDPEGEALEAAISQASTSNEPASKEIVFYLIERNISQDPYDWGLERARYFQDKEMMDYLLSKANLWTRLKFYLSSFLYD